MFLTDSDAMTLEYKAIKCLKQGNANPRVASVAKAFAMRAIQHLLDGMRYEEVKKIEQKLLDTNSK